MAEKKKNSKAKGKKKSTSKTKAKTKTKAKKKSKSRKMKTYSISGRFLMGDVLQKFEKEIKALSEKRARERIYQDLGSKHRVKRSRVLIDSVEEV
ncbi:MAG: 50S ribosomal protein L18Ae [Candidatus Methanofastidiosia archaeon]|jgi:large subunit ribosomal protein LX